MDTTAIALAYITYVLAKHPEYFGELANEISKYTDIDSFKSTELEQLPLLNAIIRETLRLWPPAPSTPARITPPHGTTFGGYFIPPAVLTIIDSKMTIRFQYIGRRGLPLEILKYIPIRKNSDLRGWQALCITNLRWLELSREQQTKLFDDTQIFGYGPRVCLGKE